MEPRDLHLGELAETINAPGGPAISSFHGDVVIGAFVDGHVQSLSEYLPADMVRKLIDRNDGGPIKGEEF
jgi:prepilin-type processing-associated H-X9-DG protein